MSADNWYKTDNVAKVFLATYNRRDTRTMRVSCTLTEDVEPDKLDEAVRSAISIRPQFQMRIRRGVFWHYMETTDAMPEIREEKGRPCPLLYGSDYNGTLHYQITYYGRRINLDMFHALSDGTGMFEFFNVIIGEYLRLTHPDNISNVSTGSGASDADLSENSFSRFYSKSESHTDIPAKAYHLTSRKLPYDQLQFIELTMDIKEMLDRARTIQTGLTGYVGALLMQAMYKDMPSLLRRQPITISVPVNLRNFYPSETSRNFFNSVNVSHVMSGDESVGELARIIDGQLKEQMDPERIRAQMDNYQRLERMMFIRLVPLVLKQPVVRRFSKMENKRVSMVLSNMGQIRPDKELAPYVEGYSAFCAHSELFFTLHSFGDKFRIGVTNAYNDTRVIKNLVRSLTDDGVTVSVNATEVVR